jgi:hypothetical protein
LMESVKEKALRIRLETERVLVHIFLVKSDPQRLRDFLKTLDGPLKTMVQEYSTRILSKLPEESEDEAGDE